MKKKITYLWVFSILWIGFDSKGYAFLDPLQQEFVSGPLTDFAKKTTENHAFVVKTKSKKKEDLDQESSD